MLPSTRTLFIPLIGLIALACACTEGGRVNDRDYNPASDGGTDADTDADSDGDSDADSDSDGDADGDSDGDSDGDGDADGDSDGDGDADGDPDDTCDEMSFSMERVPVKLMILQDMSISMEDGIPTKWSQTRSALGTMLDSWKGQNIEFGLDKFPKPADVSDSCGVSGGVIIDCAPNKEGAIKTRLNTLSPGGLTPLYCSMEKFLGNYAPNFTKTTDKKYLLVVSDGGDSCGDDCAIGDSASPDELGALTEELKAADIQTMAIGFGQETEPAELNAIAGAGGTQFDTYLQADDEVALQTALETIAATLVDCVWKLQSPDAAADPAKVNFYFDGDVVGLDEGCQDGSGWHWVDDDPTTMEIEFCEGACTELTDGLVDEVTAKFGCKSVEVV